MEPVIAELGSPVYLDANCVVYSVEGYPDFAPILRPFLSAMDMGELIAVTSELTLAETLVKPFRDHNRTLETAYREFLEPTGTLLLIPVDRDVLERAAFLRASTALHLADAIHLATALNEGCRTFLTNDRRLRTGQFGIVRQISELV